MAESENKGRASDCPFSAVRTPPKFESQTGYKIRQSEMAKEFVKFDILGEEVKVVRILEFLAALSILFGESYVGEKLPSSTTFQYDWIQEPVEMLVYGSAVCVALPARRDQRLAAGRAAVVVEPRHRTLAPLPEAARH